MRVFVPLALFLLAALTVASEPIVIQGEILKASQIPDPEKTTYKDCLTHVQCRVDEVVSGELDHDAPLVMLWGYRDRELVGDDVTVGDKVEFQLVPYSHVASRYDQIMRVDDTGVFDAPVYWAVQWKILQEGEPIEAPKEAVEEIELSRVDRMLKVFEAHGGEFYGAVASPFVFTEYEYLYQQGGYKTLRPDGKEQNAAKVIAGFRDQLSARGIELLMVFPTRSATLFPEYATNLHYDPKTDGRIDRYFVEFLEELDDLGVPYFDTLPMYLENRYEVVENGEGRYPVYIETDWHWSPYGGRMAADVVADNVKSSAWYQELERQGKTVRDFCRIEIEEGMFRSGLPEMVGGDRWPVPIRYHRVVTDPRYRDLMRKEQPDAALKIIGDSFSYYHERDDCSFHQYLVARLGIPIDVIAYPHGSATSVRQAFIRQNRLPGTKMIIWEVNPYSVFHAKDWHQVELDRTNMVYLFEELDKARFSPPQPPVVNEHVELFYKPLPAIEAFPPRNPPDETPEGRAHRVIWDRVSLGANPRLVVSMGLNREKWWRGRRGDWRSRENEADSDGVEYQVWVNGQLIAREGENYRRDREIGYWQENWEVDLSRFAGETVSLELRVDPLGTPDGDLTFWAVPKLWDGKVLDGGAELSALPGQPNSR